MQEFAKKLLAPMWCIVVALVLNKMFPNSPPGDFWFAALFFWLMWLAGRWWMRTREQRMEAAAQALRASDVSDLTPLQYEEYCAVLLRDAGWQAYTTPVQDQGVDLIATLRGTKVAIQCKMYTHPVGNKAVQEVVAGRLHYGAHLAAVVSTATYTHSARVLASSTQVLLLHHNQLPMLERIAKIR
ncbi:MAG: restriction endonuclease [Xanthobacteraceae bacterium]